MDKNMHIQGHRSISYRISLVGHCNEYIKFLSLDKEKKYVKKTQYQIYQKRWQV